MKRNLKIIMMSFFCLAVSGCNQQPADCASSAQAEQCFGDDWPGYGGAYGEQHYSNLHDIDQKNVGRLGLAWSLDLEPGNAVTQPLAIDGTVFVATGYSIVSAIDATTGKLLWRYDPKVTEVAGRLLRTGWGSRGIAWSDGSIFVATLDGRLISIDGKTGQPRWSVQTLDEAPGAYITGAPRVLGGQIIIGNAGADVAPVRGYVTSYDAETGKRIWRFYTVPGEPAKGFESPAMEMAAKSWSGEWWKFGGGGTVWNAITYDPEFATVYIGTGNGAPWNHRIRSAGKGDNLFLASIVALDAKTGAYKWHYQVNPAETWDYNAAMDMALATLDIDGKPRKVLIQAPKNGFVYVIDRANGELISAKPFVKTSWATGIDLKTGRPEEANGARFPGGSSFDLYPGSIGAHSWLPMAFSRKSRLIYIPTLFIGSRVSDKGINPAQWTRYPGLGQDGGISAGIISDDPDASQSALIAWDPVAQREMWRIATDGPTNGGVMATAGDLVFQGQIDGRFRAYDAETGNPLWSFAAQAPVIAPPITFRSKGVQYVTVIAGFGTGSGALGPLIKNAKIDYRSQARRILTFAIDGKAVLPPSPPVVVDIPDDPSFHPLAKADITAVIAYGRRCAHCHGIGAIAAGNAPDLRASSITSDASTFEQIVRGGALQSQGMPRFEEMDEQTLEGIRNYVRAQAAIVRQTRSKRRTSIIP